MQIVIKNFISSKEAAQKWNISQKRVVSLCKENTIQGAILVGESWFIPANAEKPSDKSAPKPFVKWAGGKSRLIPELEKRMGAVCGRVFTKYAEPMVGGGAFLFYNLSKSRFEEFYISDINAELINCYVAIKENVENLIVKLRKMQDEFLKLSEKDRKTYYFEIRDKFNTIELNDVTKFEKAAYFIFLNKTCFNGLYRVNKEGLFNVPMGKYKHPNILDEDNLRNVSSVLQYVRIVCGDYSLAETFIDRNTVVYIDPPYRPLSKTSCFTAYNSETFDDGEQIRLADFVDKISGKGAKILMSNSDPKNENPQDEFFNNLYGDYNIDSVEVNRTINSDASKRGEIKELIIYN